MIQSNFKHTPVLLKESIDYLNVVENGLYIDCTLGGAGHTQEILDKKAVVISIDQDIEAIKNANKLLCKAIDSQRLYTVNDNYSKIAEIVGDLGFKDFKVDGILYDLGLSTNQIKNSAKGYSFTDNSILDMRSNSNLNVTASDLIRVLRVDQLEIVLRDYGEVRNYKKIAAFLKKYAKDNAKIYALSLADNIKLRFGTSNDRIHPATLIFQALRIAVNSELENLENSLNSCYKILKLNGRICIITFHSLEDKIVHKTIGVNNKYKKVLTKPIRPSFDEMIKNRSSRSAKLHVYEKVL